MIKRFEDLDAWLCARKLVNEIYAMTRLEGLCRDYGLCSQLQRASVSVMSNIAEGFERLHPGEKIQAYNVARGSAAEVRSLSYVVEDNFPALTTLAGAARSNVIRTGRLINGLIQSTRRSRGDTAD
jgi:four helix bundle protein